jgi:hypothetical protein
MAGLRLDDLHGQPDAHDGGSLASARTSTLVADAARVGFARALAFVARQRQMVQRDGFVVAQRGASRQRRAAPLAQICDARVQRPLERRLHARTQAAAVVLDLFRLAADQHHAARILAGQLREHQHFLEAGLVQAHLAHAEKLRHLVVLDDLQLPGARP